MEEQNVFLERSEAMKIIDYLRVEDIYPAVSSTALGIFLAVPNERRIFFTDGMESVCGPIIKQDVLLSSFMQFVPHEERDDVTHEYEQAFNELVVNGGTQKIKHRLSKSFAEEYEVETSLTAVNFSKKTYIFGIIVDRTADIIQLAGRQLFKGDADEYFFIFDSYEDRIFVSDKTKIDFDLSSNLVEGFAQKFASLMNPEDADKLKNAIVEFINDGTFDPTQKYRFLSVNRGEVYLRLNCLTDADSINCNSGEKRYITGALSDVTEETKSNLIRDSIIEGTAGVTFYCSLKTKELVFSEEISEVIPGFKQLITGDISNTLTNMVVPEDRKRFKDLMHSIIDGYTGNFSIEVRIVDEKEKFIWIACRGKAVFDENTQAPIAVGSVFNLSQMNEIKENIERNASCHELTGLPTREKMISDVQKKLQDKDLLSAALVLVDINGFHTFNDRYGHSAGNEIILASVNQLRQQLPDKASVYQMSIDSFCIFWPHASRAKVSDYMGRLSEMSSAPLETGHGSFFISYGISASIYPFCGSKVEELLVNAEIALHKVKQDKKLKYAIYSPVDKAELKERLDFELQISQSIRNDMDSFQLYYQPLTNAKSEKLEGAEALLRWVAPNGELVNPERVVNALESTDHMETVGIWILNQAASQCAKWIQNGADPNFYIHVNVTADDLVRRDFAGEVISVLTRYNLSPRNILLEITETSLMKNITMCRQNIVRLRVEGVKIALDDFGTGYSNFSYLKDLPVDEIKIDKSFVDDMETDAFSRSFINAITMLTHSIRKKVVVEGVESENQLNLVRDLGCDIIQGYYFGKPLTVFNFENKYFK